MTLLLLCPLLRLAIASCDALAVSAPLQSIRSKVSPADVVPVAESSSSDEWNPFNDDDDETCLIVDEASVDHILKEPPWIRALEIAGIVMTRVVVPLSRSVLEHGGVTERDDWNEFWARPNHGRTNADRLTHALEELGVVYVKFGQALASRADAIPMSLANSLSKLQDCMQPFDSESAKQIVTKELLETNKLTRDEMENLLECLDQDPIASASVGQVYKVRIGSQQVAVKVQRPGIRALMERDASLLKTVANWVESIPAPAFLQPKHGKQLDRLIAAELEDSVEEFFDRVFEELDYRNEAANAAKFAELYSNRGGSSKHARVIVPKIYPDLCTDNVLVMEWLDGTKLTCIDKDDKRQVAENLAVIKQAIDCTLSQLLDTGVLHADPHGGNLLKIQTPKGPPQLGYLDFGLLASVPQQVRDALVCAVAHLVFDHDSEAVAMLFAELQIVPEDVIQDPMEKKALTQALNQTMNDVLIYPDNSDTGAIEFPELEFDKLITSLTGLVPRFRFQLPPYFMQKARALGILEGMARSLDTDFNILQMLYPYALNRLMVNPTQSAVMDDTLQNLITSSETGRVELDKISKLLDDSAHLTGYRRRKVIRDVLKTSGGRRLARKVVKEQVKDASGHLKRRFRKKG